MIRKFANKVVDSAHTRKYQTLNEAFISRSNIIHNFKTIKALDPGHYATAVLKANAYGHGLKQIAKILNDTDCEFIDVDGYFEADRIINVTNHKILVMGYILPENVHLLNYKRCSFVIQDQAGINAFGKSGKAFKIHMEINSGMNRLGIRPEEIKDYLEVLSSFENLELEGVMTHLADADNPDSSFTDFQVKGFDDAVKRILDMGIRPKYIHIAQSAGSAKVKSKYANMVRAGVGLYGINPLSKSDSNYSKLTNLRPAMGLKSTIIKVIDLSPGDRVSYNGIYEAKERRKIAVLPLGYYEWVPRELSNKGFVSAQGTMLPIRGRVCMNHTMIDITGTSLKIGNKIDIFSTDNRMNSIQNIADEYGLFTYSLLTRLADSVRRTIVD